MKTKDYSVVEKLIIAAYKLEEQGKKPFSAEDLVVKAWRLFPETFGLSGQVNESKKSLFPDSNRVFAEIMGSKPIRKRGYLVKVGEKLYQLTEAGAEYAKVIVKRKRGVPIKKSILSREIKNEIKRLISTRVFDKVKNERVDEITFHDACSFWQISPRSSAIEVSGRLSRLEKILEIFREYINDSDIAFEHGGDPISAREKDLLFLSHKTLQEKFKNEIDLIMRRIDER